MAQLINEAKRMQQLAGIIKEASKMDDIAMSFSNTSPNTSPGATAGETPLVNTVNTPDEERLEDVIEKNPLIKQRLKNINNISELDGFFKIIMSFTNVDKISKSNFINALKKAMENIAKDSPTITTKKNND